MGRKRAEKRRMDELDVEVVVKESFKKKFVKNRLKWAGMGDEQFVKRSDAQKVEGKSRRGRPKMQWEDCVKRNM